MEHKEHVALFGSGKRDNISFTLNAGEIMVCYFQASGNNDANNKYYNLGHFAHKVGITVSAVATITHVGNQELQSPRTLGTATMNVFSVGIEWEKITVRAGSDATTFEIYAS